MVPIALNAFMGAHSATVIALEDAIRSVQPKATATWTSHKSPIHSTVWLFVAQLTFFPVRSNKMCASLSVSILSDETTYNTRSEIARVFSKYNRYRLRIECKKCDYKRPEIS